MKSFVITSFVNPIALITDISLHYSYRLPVILELKLKKQMNIVITMTREKMVSSVNSAYIKLNKKNLPSWCCQANLSTTKSHTFL